MRFLVAASALVAVAAATRRTWLSDDPHAAPGLWKTADWYTEHGLPLPELAPAIMTVESNKSYAVKLECVACPRQKRPTDILLDFTIDSTASALLLNNEPIAPLGPMPLSIYPTPVPANVSKEALRRKLSMHGPTPSWVKVDKMANSQLQFEHALVPTRQHGRSWIQFDVTAVHIRAHGRHRKAMLVSEEQKMVQVLLREERGTGHLSIEDIQLVLRKDRVMPFKMDCGRYAIRKTVYNPEEWDSYGQFGTATRLWHLVSWKAREWSSLDTLIRTLSVVFVALAIYRVVKLRREKAAVRAKEGREDVEAALLMGEPEDAPPAYEDESVMEERGEEKEEQKEERA